MSDLGPLERYRPLVDDWSAFAVAVTSPLPLCAWTNRLRIDAQGLQSRLSAAGLSPRALEWVEGAYRLETPLGAGNCLPFVAGLCHLQEEASLLPPMLLDAQPGERVLDLCAAPGGKTAKIGIGMEDRGTLVANDRSPGRLHVLRSILARLGLTSLVVTAADGVGYSPRAGLFDRVLADVPCSCEGNSRKSPGVLRRPRVSRREWLPRTQLALLDKAIQCCAGGGRVVYSTCTYDPDENEAVVDQALDRWGPRGLRVVPVEVPGLRVAPGVVAWQGRRFSESLAHSLRIWPHHNDTGGFFVAVLEKGEPQSWSAAQVYLEEGSAAEAESAAARVEAPLPKRASGELNALQPLGKGFDVQSVDVAVQATERYGIDPSVFEGMVVVGEGSRRNLLAVETQPPERPIPLSLGLPLAQTSGRHPKLSTAAAMRFGPLATRNRILATSEQLADYLARRSIVVGLDQGGIDSPGYVLVGDQDSVFGVGRALRVDEGWRVHSLFPKGWMVPLGGRGFEKDENGADSPVDTQATDVVVSKGKKKPLVVGE